MRCTSPKTVGFYADGKTLCWSPKKFSKEYPIFQLPCGKCVECRLEYARQWAVRCVHEAHMHENNSFITLTYDEQNLKSANLVYTDFQTFVKNLRSHIFEQTLKEIFPNVSNQSARRELYRKLEKITKENIKESSRISIFVTGEYGDQRKRPHWHACIFNWKPADAEYKYSNERGDKAYTSQTLSQLWPHGLAEFGSVTFESAGYCARYAAKKLAHGADGTHPYDPISKKSSKNAIGKKFLEKFWRDLFNIGKVILPNGDSCSIPRYYEKWLAKHNPSAYRSYVTQLKQRRLEEATAKEELIKKQEFEINMARTAEEGPQISRNQVRKLISEKKFQEQLQAHNKL